MTIRQAVSYTAHQRTRTANILLGLSRAECKVCGSSLKSFSTFILTYYNPVVVICTTFINSQ